MSHHLDTPLAAQTGQLLIDDLYLFPSEGHELTRSGRPRHRVQRFEAVLDWWARHL